ncbi:MAG: hypothetical protein R3F30_12560 [Planctomycetota bacterium]
MTLALGGAWLAVHGPDRPRDLLIRCLELGFDAVLPGPGPRPRAWAALAEVWDDLPIRAPAIRVDGLLQPERGNLASDQASEVQEVHRRVEGAAALGRKLRTRVLILEAPRLLLEGFEDEEGELSAARTAWSPDRWRALVARLDLVRDRALERCCRNLFQISKSFPDMQLCLTESSSAASLSEPGVVAAIRSDLERQGVGYWHRPAVVARRGRLGGAGPEETLELLGDSMVGTDLSDCREADLLAPPGSGIVDFGLLAPYMKGLRIDRPGVLEADPSVSIEELGQARSYLRKYGV